MKEHKSTKAPQDLLAFRQEPLIGNIHGRASDEWSGNGSTVMQFGGTLVPVTKTFLRDWKKLPEAHQKIARKKIELLLYNRAHPSLSSHHLHRACVWECKVSLKIRLLYQLLQAGTILLCRIGSHAIVDQCR